MDDSTLLVGLDIGTTNVKAVVADTQAHGFHVIGADQEATRGMRHGKIVDIDQTAASIAKTLKNVSEKTNSKIYRVVTGIPINMLQLQRADASIKIGDQGKEVDDEDVKEVLGAAIHQATESGREPITYLPSKFLIDGKTDVDDPRKMIAHQLDVDGILLTAPVADLHNIKKAIERAGYQNNFFIPTPLAIASVALDEEERTFGSIIVDMGGGSTTATVIHENKIKYAKVDFEGGADVTHDISVVLNTSSKTAEQIKLDFGYADPDLTSKDDKFPVNIVGQTKPQLVDEQYLSQIINARLTQILSRLGKSLEKHEAFQLPGGVVITGGASSLQGTQDYLREMYDVKARTFQPDQMGMRQPAFAAAYGIVTYAYQLADIDYLVNGVLYGDNVFSDSRAAENHEFSKRHGVVNEMRLKEAYNKKESNPVPVGHKTGSKRKENDKKGFKQFFKKFFD